MHEEIMRVTSADIRDDDHGSARIEIELEGNSGCQSYVPTVTSENAYALLVLFQVEYLHKAVGKPIIALRDEPYGYIRGLRRLPCDPPYTVGVPT